MEFRVILHLMIVFNLQYVPRFVGLTDSWIPGSEAGQEAGRWMKLTK